MDLQAWLRERLAPVETALDAALPAEDRPPRALHAAIRHLVFPGGKRLRPALALAAAEAVGAAAECALPVATAVELIHTYSLVHDDLPCMDDDDVRRGRPAVHAKFGEALAVLAGDALLAAAFESLAGPGHVGAPERRLAAVRDLARAAGTAHLVGGQADDLRFEPGENDAARIESVHARKSAALIAASIVGGARLGGADEATVALLGRCGERVGVAFQIADDLVDHVRDGACSLVRALGPERARERAESLLASALEETGGLGERAEPLRGLLRFAVGKTE